VNELIKRARYETLPPSRSRYAFRLSAFSRFLSPSSLSFVASFLVTARTTSNVLPCRTRLCARLDEGSGVNIEGSLNGLGFTYSRRISITDAICGAMDPTVEVGPVVSRRKRSLFSTALSASSTFQKQTKPVPLDRPVSWSIVMRA